MLYEYNRKIFTSLDRLNDYIHNEALEYSQDPILYGASKFEDIKEVQDIELEKLLNYYVSTHEKIDHKLRFIAIRPFGYMFYFNDHCEKPRPFTRYMTKEDLIQYRKDQILTFFA